MSFLATENPAHDDQPRKIVMHVNFADPQRLNFVLNNTENICDYYREKGNEVAIRVVCHGPGLHMLRIDTSPVLERLEQLPAGAGEVGFYACTNTVQRMSDAEGKRPEIIERAVLVPAGLPEIIELQRLGWIYLKP